MMVIIHVTNNTMPDISDLVGLTIDKKMIYRVYHFGDIAILHFVWTPY